MKKVVYILGAGFSIEANSPSQEALVRKIFEIHKSMPNEFKKGSVKRFENFLTKTLLVPKKLHNNVPLEDIFTPLDRCIADNISFRNLDLRETLEIRELIYYLIGKTIEVALLNSEGDYINYFAHFLADKASTRRGGNYARVDPVSVISTNWDILLDNAIKRVIRDTYQDKAVVDYCCHISSYEPTDKTVKPGLEMLGMGGFNVKLLKLHGSLNWLQCPRCLRVYVDFNNKIVINQYVHPVNCRHCDKHFGVYNSHRLVSNLIMPTFLKNFSNPQYKLIWQNAGIELSEAEKVVFIGYSLPQADFEMRQLLSRMVRDDAKVEVVDFGEEDSLKIIETKNRYKVFFGNREPRFFLKGAKDYILNNIQ
jgi:hypothetical protein